MAYIEKRVSARRDRSGRAHAITRYRVRYREPSGRLRVETFIKAVDAERRRAEVEVALAGSVWRDPRRGEIKLSEWVTVWLPTRHDLRATTRARLETTMRSQVLPRFGRLPLDRIGNGVIRVWVSELLAAGLSAATVRKAVFALRQCLGAAVADGRLTVNPALEIPLPSERQKSPCFLSRVEVEQLVEAMPARYAALILVGAYAGLRCMMRHVWAPQERRCRPRRTEHPTKEGKLYCCVVMDSYSRRVVGLAIDSRHRADLAGGMRRGRKSCARNPPNQRG